MPEVPQHPVVAQLVSDPSAPPRLLIIAGYVGRSARADHVRVYRSLALDAFVEIPAHDVVYSQPYPELPLNGTLVWVKSHATIFRDATLDQAAFLRGGIAADYLAAGVPGYWGTGSLVFVPPKLTPGCTPNIFWPPWRPHGPPGPEVGPSEGYFRY